MARIGIGRLTIVCRAMLVCAGVPCAIAGNGYLLLSAGAARGNFDADSPSSVNSRGSFRVAGGMDFDPRLGVEVGIARTQGFAPTNAILSLDTRARVNVTTIDVAMVARYAPTDRLRLFVSGGPTLASTRAEISIARGRATALGTARELTWRASAGLDFAVSGRLAIQLAVSRIGPVGKSTGSLGTGRSAVDSVLVGALVHF